MKAVLGISALFHDSAAALVVDGRVVAAAEEERFSRKKHDSAFPTESISYCLREARISASDLTLVTFYEKPHLKLDRLLRQAFQWAPHSLSIFLEGIPAFAQSKLDVRALIEKSLGSHVPSDLITHHESHAASAFYPSPFDEAAIITVDGVGEWTTLSLGVGSGACIDLRLEQRFPHSLGLLYSAFTDYCGFRVNSGEYKLMGLAAYGQPSFKLLIEQHLLRQRHDGSFVLKLDYFDFHKGGETFNSKFEALFGKARREPSEPVNKHYADVAASIQCVLEDCILRIARFWHKETGLKNVVLAGGVALNGVANGRLLREGPFSAMWIQPAAGDSGGALGAALYGYHMRAQMSRKPSFPDAQRNSLLGPSYNDEEIKNALSDAELKWEEIGDFDDLCRFAANELYRGKTIAWFQGRMEFGPRALGSRSILASPLDGRTKDKLNANIKLREDFRPFAPAVMLEHAHEWFDWQQGCGSPYMLFVTKVRGGRIGLPAVTHVDGTARLQTVDQDGNPKLYKLLHAFRDVSGCPVLLNTSFNVRGEPIACTPQDAIRCFKHVGIDLLIIGKYVVERVTSQVPLETSRIYANQFELD